MKMTEKPNSRGAREISCRISRCTSTSSAVVGSSMIMSWGSQGEGHGDHDALAHAAGELVRVGAQAVAADLDEVEQVAALLRRVAGLISGRCVSKTSSSCLPMVMTGLSEFIAPWKTIEILSQRNSRISSSSRRVDVDVLAGLVVEHDGAAG